METLNLSCNRIVSIAGLEGMLHCLKKLVLSHNRIATLHFFSQAMDLGLTALNLELLDLNDNYVSSLDQVQHLKRIAGLKEVVF